MDGDDAADYWTGGREQPAGSALKLGLDARGPGRAVHLAAGGRWLGRWRGGRAGTSANGNQSGPKQRRHPRVPLRKGRQHPAVLRFVASISNISASARALSLGSYQLLAQSLNRTFVGDRSGRG